jgi:GDP-L-fucose synthase
LAKIAGIKLCESFNAQYGTRYTSVMPTNLYGPGDNYDLQNSHVLPALIRKAHEAKLRGDTEYVVWGSGKPMREFLYVDDLADACVQLMTAGYHGPLLNIGTGVDVTIRELAEQVIQVVGLGLKVTFLKLLQSILSLLLKISKVSIPDQVFFSLKEVLQLSKILEGNQLKSC